MKQPSRVLVVDDKETARESLQLLLFGFDCIFTEAKDGAEALELIRSSEFDVIFLDLKLPDMDGIEVFREAKKLSARLGKVIIVTALPDPQTEAEAHTLGAFKYLTKLDHEEIRLTFAEATSDSPQSPKFAPAVEVDPSVGTLSTPNTTALQANSTLPHLLVLDDSEDWLDTMQDVLKGDFRLSRTTDAEKACLWAKNQSFALVILDMKLPGGVSGLDVLSRMRKTSPDLRAIILTAYPDYRTALEGGRRGAIAYVSKQELGTLADTVKGILSQKGKPIRLFLSYDSRDQEQVSDLYEKLMSRGFLPWMDSEDIIPGKRWKRELRKAIEQSDYFIFCLSHNSLHKEGILREELKRARKRQKGMLQDSIFFITARLEDVEVEEPFNKLQYVDLFKSNGFTKLLHAISSNEKAR